MGKTYWQNLWSDTCVFGNYTKLVKFVLKSLHGGKQKKEKKRKEKNQQNRYLRVRIELRNLLCSSLMLCCPS